MPRTTFLAVYTGATIAEARLLAVSTDPTLVEEVVTRLLGEKLELSDDPAVRALDEGRRRALRTSLPSRTAKR